MSDDWLKHDSHDLFYRNPFGAVACGQKVRLRLTVARGLKPEKVVLYMETEMFVPREAEKVMEAKESPAAAENNSTDNTINSNIITDNTITGHTAIERAGVTRRIEVEKKEIVLHSRLNSRGENIYETEITAPPVPGLIWYYFKATEGEHIWFCGSSKAEQGGPSRIGAHIPYAYQITVHQAGAVTPAWFKDAVIYQIFPDRFFNGTPDGRVVNPKKNSLLHAHWDNDPLYIRKPTGEIIRWDFFGGNLWGIIKKLPFLRQLGIDVIYLNPIFASPSNHRYDTADYHRLDPMLGTNRLFARLCRQARELGISIILDGVFSHTGSDSIYFNKEGNYPGPGAYQSPDSPYYKWYSFEAYPDEYDSWWGIDTMPNVNELEPSYQDFIIEGENSVIKHWMKLGARGWRLDVADELPGEFIRKLRRTLKEFSEDAVLIGEVWEDASHKISYGERRSYLLGDELDAVMNYPFRGILLDFLLGKTPGDAVGQALLSLAENYPRENFYANMNLLSSHDQPRIQTLLSDGLPEDLAPAEKERAVQELFKMAIIWQMTFPGTPSVYYGDEAGLTGGEDPLNRRPYPWGQENRELLHYYQEMIALRQHYDVLRTGDWSPLYGAGDVFAYERSIEGEADIFGQPKKDNAAVIIFNRSLRETHTIELELPDGFTGQAVDVQDDYQEIPLSEGLLQLTLPPCSGRILLRDRWGDNLAYRRECGLLLHPTSLPGPHGIGSLGDEAYAWVDFLQESGQQIWQFLPLNPPGYGESPYQCYSAFAGNPLLIDLPRLVAAGLLEAVALADPPPFPADRVDFMQVQEYKEKLFRLAFRNLAAYLTTGTNQEDYDRFVAENQHWLPDYALYMALKTRFGGQPWTAWDEDVARREETALDVYQQMLAEEIAYQQFLQYLFFSQWKELKNYARAKGISLMGDLPIFVSHDSSDVWKNPHLFALDAEGNPTKVAGVPPDYFSENGQLWGNPHYRWEEMAKDGYQWWRERFATLARLVDIIRIDHFRGFEAYWEVAGGETTAKNGRWVKGPGEKFFRAIKEQLGDIRIVAEDLGVITPEVEDLKTACGYPGMIIMQFALEEKPEQEFRLPLAKNDTFVYTGTHDNDTMLGWFREKYQGRKDLAGLTAEEICWYFIERAYRSPARAVIIPLQDVLALDSTARMNTPGTAEGNWLFRFFRDSLTPERAARLKELAARYSFQRD